jgi:hypothetical protein
MNRRGGRAVQANGEDRRIEDRGRV